MIPQQPDGSMPHSVADRNRTRVGWSMGSSRIGGSIALVAATACVSLVWLVILPRHAQRPSMRDHLRWLDKRGIDPSAMYYTELEVMDSILARHRARELAQQRRP